MRALKRIHALPPALTAAVHARPNRIDTASSVSFRLMDRAARSPFHCGVGHVGVRARANASRCVRRLEVAVRRSAGALAATRQQSYGCACSDVRFGSTSTTFNIITIITIYISHGGCRNVYASGGLCVLSSWLEHVYTMPFQDSRQQLHVRDTHVPMNWLLPSPTAVQVKPISTLVFTALITSQYALGFPNDVWHLSKCQ